MGSIGNLTVTMSSSDCRLVYRDILSEQFGSRVKRFCDARGNSFIYSMPGLTLARDNVLIWMSLSNIIFVEYYFF